MKAVLLATLAFAVLAPGTAAAHECGDGFAVGGAKPFCGNRGGGYSVPMVRIELGVVSQQILFDPGDAQDSGLAPGAVEARGGRFRFAWGIFGRLGIYSGGELTLTAFDAIRPAGAARGDLPGVAVDGRTAEITMMAGMRRAAGRLTYGLELAGGLRNAWFDGAPEHQSTAEGVLEVRPMLGVSLTRFISVNAMVGQSMLHRDEHHVMFAIGASLFPWDGLR